MLTFGPNVDLRQVKENVMSDVENEYFAFQAFETTMGMDSLRSLDSYDRLDSLDSTGSQDEAGSSGCPEYKNPIFVSNLNRNNQYDCKSHFIFWLFKTQADETNDVPIETLRTVRKEMDVRWITDPNMLTQAVVRDILKEHGLSKYYENTNYIINVLTEKKFVISDEIVDKLYEMYDRIQAIYSKHIPKGRKSFFSYFYFFHKLFLLLGQDQYTSYFPVLKNREKIYEQEDAFESICNELGWTFIPSV